MDGIAIFGIAVGSFALGIFAHQIWVKIVVWHTLREMRRAGIDIEELLRDDAEPVQDTRVECRLEEHEGTWFLYRKDNDEFVAQGRNKQELSDAVTSRFPDKLVIATDIDDEVRQRFAAQADA
jgi:hypothetical protein